MFQKNINYSKYMVKLIILIILITLIILMWFGGACLF